MKMSIQNGKQYACIDLLLLGYFGIIPSNYIGQLCFTVLLVHFNLLFIISVIIFSFIFW